MRNHAPVLLEVGRAADDEPGDDGSQQADQRHDRAEALAVRDTLGDVPVTAHKSYFGNLSGGAGAVELAISLLNLESGRVPFTLNYEQPDPNCPINVVRGTPVEVPRRSVLALNQTSMGQSVAMLVRGDG